MTEAEQFSEVVAQLATARNVLSDRIAVTHLAAKAYLAAEQAEQEAREIVTVLRHRRDVLDVDA